MRVRARRVRAVLSRVLESETVEELLAGDPRERALAARLLVEVARGREGALGRKLEEFARRRGITPAYLADRAMVFLATLAELRRQDLYLALGIHPAAPTAEVRRRWRAIARGLHPDAVGGGGPSAAFLALKAAYETLADPARRARYDAFWLRRVAPLLPVLCDQRSGVLRSARSRPGPGPRPVLAPERMPRLGAAVLAAVTTVATALAHQVERLAVRRP